jgi:hypothetical protein
MIASIVEAGSAVAHETGSRIAGFQKPTAIASVTRFESLISGILFSPIRSQSVVRCDCNRGGGSSVSVLQRRSCRNPPSRRRLRHTTPISQHPRTSCGDRKLMPSIPFESVENESPAV